VLADPTYNFQVWHGVLLYWGLILFSVVINTVVSSLLPKFEGLILILHILGFFAIMFPLIILGPHASASEVFQTFVNGGNWPTNGLSFMVGLLGNVFAFFGADAAIHMSEEIQGAAVVVPRSIMMSIVLNGSMGFGMAIALLFCLGDIDAALNTPTGYPFIEIFYQAVNSTTGASLMTAVILTLAVCATVGTMASASRQLWSFSRDRAVPGWRYIQRVNSKTAVPVTSVVITTIISCALSMIIFGSSTVFNDIVSLSVVGLFGSYFLAAVLLLYRRCRNDISPYEKDSSALTNVPGAPLSWGPWRIPGALGLINNIFTVCYLFVIWFFSFWPPAIPVEASTMNYGCVMLGGTMILSIIYYVFWAKGVYQGPVVEF
jgi:choline transport protein